jgi:5-oxoprolinase (ATP-hydrolysing) subunit A
MSGPAGVDLPVLSLPVLDLNADLGESYGAWRLGDDEALLGLVTSANIACGFHAGDPLTIRRACAGAVARQVTIGAQVSYRDLAGFGRREMSVPPDELAAEVLYQLAALDGIARAEGGRVRYVKPHGALYNRAVRDPEQAAAIVAAIRSYDAALPVLTLPGSALAAAADSAGLPVVAETFADRAYNDDATLVGRGQPGAVLTDPEVVAARVTSLATRGFLRSASGRELRIGARSVCVHGDTEGAVQLASKVRAALEDAGVRLVPFA